MVKFTVSGNPCPKCAVWENRAVSIAGATKGYPLLQTAVDEGMFHPNCTHSTVAVTRYDIANSYDDNGRPLEGINSKGNEAPPSDDKEANREYRKSFSTIDLTKEMELLGAEKIKGTHTQKQDLLATNPNFVTGEDRWILNCQRCITAYEARRRGLDVEALPTPSAKTTDNLAASLGWTQPYNNGQLIDCSSTSGQNSRDKIIQAMSQMPNGSRCAVQVLWNKRSGHVFIAEKHKNKVSFIDPQVCKTSEQLDASGYFDLASGEFCYIMRLDKLKFNDIIKECCKGAKK